MINLKEFQSIVPDNQILDIRIGENSLISEVIQRILSIAYPSLRKSGVTLTVGNRWNSEEEKKRNPHLK